MLKYFLLLLTLSTFQLASGQLYSADIRHPDNRIITQWLRDQQVQQDSVTWIMARTDLMQRLHNSGYLLAEIEQWQFEKDTLKVEIAPGSVIHWAKLSFKGLEYLPAHWVAALDQSGQIVNYNTWQSQVKNVLRAAQSEGYLFADYQLLVIGLENDSLKAQIIFDPGLKIVLDTIEIEGNARISQKYLEKTIGIEEGEPLTPDAIRTLYEQLDNLRFVRQKAPPVLILFGERAAIRVYLDNRNSSSFDILAGFQPSGDPDRNLTITGYAELDLINQLTRGERIYLHVEKLRARSQELEMALAYPYLLDLPFGVEGEFKLWKNNTLYSELEWKAGVSLPLGRDQYVRAGVTEKATNIISIDRNRIIATKRLPAYVDLRIKGLTLGLSRNRLDFDLNPRKGYSIIADASFYQRKVRENSSIIDLSLVDTSFNYASLYDSIRDQSTKIEVETAIQYFIPWGARSTVRLAVDGGFMQTSEKLFENELFRLGGYARLRGFDEESILAQYYSIFSIEYRLIIGGASYVSLFGDYAWVKNVDAGARYEDRPFGFGFGLTFETKAGIFGARLAVGAQQGNAIDFDNARVHIGYVNRF